MGVDLMDMYEENLLNTVMSKQAVGIGDRERGCIWIVWLGQASTRKGFHSIVQIVLRLISRRQVQRSVSTWVECIGSTKHCNGLHISKMSLLQKTFDIVLIPALAPRCQLAVKGSWVFLKSRSPPHPVGTWYRTLMMMCPVKRLIATFLSLKANDAIISSLSLSTSP